MSLPSLAKTWQYSVNNAITSQGSAKLDNARALRLVKNALIGFASNPWTVRYSCNSTTAGTAGDAVDRWAADTDLVWVSTSGARSWIVLRQTGIASNFEVCIDLLTGSSSATTGGFQMVLAVSPSAGFTGGSTTARPTATDESTLWNKSQWTTLTTDLSTRYSVMQSSDGQCTRVWGSAGGSPTFSWIFDKPANTVTGWSNPSYSFASSGAPTIANLCGYNGVMRSGTTNGSVAMGCETAGTVILPNDTTSGAVANEISGEWIMVPTGICCNTTGIKGRHGTLQDLWLGSGSIATGDTYGTAQFVQIGGLILPWNGGAVNLS